MIPAAIATAALALSLAQGPAPVLSFEEALRRADQANLDLKAAREKEEQAKAGIWKAWSGYLLQIGAVSTYTRNDTAAEMALPTGFYVRDLGTPQGPPAGGAVPGEPTHLAVYPSGSTTSTLQARDQLVGQVQATQALIAPQLWFAIAEAYRAEAAAAQGVEHARRGILFGVAQAYYGVASLKRLVEVSQQLLEIAARQERDAEVRFQAGTIPRAGLLRARIERVRAEQDRQRAQNAYQSGRIALAVLLDREADFEVAEPPDLPEPADPETLERSALSDRPDVQAARSMEELYAMQRRVSAMRYLPSLGAFARYQGSNVRGFTGRTDAWAVGLALTWTLLDGGLREAELRDTGSRIAEAEANRRSLENRAVAEVRQALLDLASARANARKAREQRDLAAENQRLLDVSYRAGTATAVEQADATASLRSAEIALAAESLQAQLGVIRVLKAAGSFDPVSKGR